ncbi:MAG TPA: hypothetical protein V6C82_07120, partial [Chroococcales cyanobacterium]
EQWAAFYFDFEVAPLFRERGLKSKIFGEAFSLAESSGIGLHYFYCALDDLAAVDFLRNQIGGEPVGSYHTLRWPVYRKKRTRRNFASASAGEVHETYLRECGPFDFYSNPLENGKLPGYVASFSGEKAGCSIWSNEELLPERVVSTSVLTRIAREVISYRPFDLFSWPRLPAPGGLIKRWFLFDFWAENPDSAVDLMCRINNLGLEKGIDSCEVVHQTDQSWVGELRAAAPILFSPVRSFTLLLKSKEGGMQPLIYPYVDVRDLAGNRG